jgi:predicted polyphosphate/ATP-dependent NAD kinase
MATVGIIASPSAGKDVRRLVGNAGSVGDVDKIASIRRAAHGAVEGGATRLVILDDTRHLVLRAVEGLAAAAGVTVELVDLETIGTGSDSRRAAAAMADMNAGAVVVFGGDGTNRDVAKGWPDAAVMPLAVGTNNVFPSTVEPTIGGVAAGLVASGAVALADVAHRAKRIEVTIDDHHDAALVDVVLVRGDFIGSRAVWHAEDLVAAVFAMAESDSVGLSSIAGVMAPVGRPRPLRSPSPWAPAARSCGRRSGRAPMSTSRSSRIAGSSWANPSSWRVPVCWPSTASAIMSCRAAPSPG